MADPTNVPEEFGHCADVPCVLGGVLMKIESGGFKVPANVDEMTYDGYYRDVETIKKATFSLKIAYTGAAALAFVSGGIYPMRINYGADGASTTPGNPSFKGDVRISLDDAPTLDRKAGIHLSVTGTSQGPFEYKI